MFGQIFNKALGYVKVSKENWTKIEILFQEKTDKINSLEKELNNLKAECKDALRYKDNDKLVQIYENMIKNMKEENTTLKEELANLDKGLNTALKKVDTVMSLEDAYLKRIVNLQHKCDKAELNMNCPEYEEKGSSLLEIYA
jgi:LPS O-antigen subunit length determinant protein (WzzB/FepE family)